MRALAITAGLLAAGCAAPMPSETPDPVIELCGARLWSYKSVQQFLAPHGIRTVWMGSDLGCDHVFVRGRATAFRARALLQASQAKERLNLAWSGDYVEVSGCVRVASVDWRVTATETVLARLEQHGVQVELRFGATIDRIWVEGECASLAVEILEIAELPGVVVERW